MLQRCVGLKIVVANRLVKHRLKRNRMHFRRSRCCRRLYLIELRGLKVMLHEQR